MNIFSCFEAEFQTIISNLVATKQVVAGLDTSRVVFELPRDESHGDIATNAAMVLAKQAGKSPRDLASLFASELEKIDGVIA
ncbi:MAG: arginine--tRNA ligase, partial [Candidatus Puniceispirillaceae bacterium]